MKLIHPIYKSYCLYFSRSTRIQKRKFKNNPCEVFAKLRSNLPLTFCRSNKSHWHGAFGKIWNSNEQKECKVFSKSSIPLWTKISGKSLIEGSTLITLRQIVVFISILFLAGSHGQPRFQKKHRFPLFKGWSGEPSSAQQSYHARSHQDRWRPLHQYSIDVSYTSYSC